jgi:hypothetical protein
MFGWREMKGE